jgi:hypothetical protein
MRYHALILSVLFFSFTANAQTATAPTAPAAASTTATAPIPLSIAERQQKALVWYNALSPEEKTRVSKEYADYEKHMMKVNEDMRSRFAGKDNNQMVMFSYWFNEAIKKRIPAPK